MVRSTIAALVLGLTLGVGSAMAASPAAAPISAAADPVQFYVFSFTDTPVADVAQDVVGSALGYELAVDPAVEGQVTFSANGWYSGQALLQDFGSALLDQDIALIRTAPGAYVLSPRANLPMLMARGGELQTLPTPATAAPPSPAAADAEPRPVYGRARWWDGALGALLIFFAGALAGGAALFGGQAVYRRAEAQGRIAPPLLRLTDQRLRFQKPAEASDADPELVIPRFEEDRRA